MDLLNISENPSTMNEQNADESIMPEVQINPLTIMASVSPSQQIEDDQQNTLESLDVDLAQDHRLRSGVESLNPDVSSPDGFGRPSNISDQHKSANNSIDNRAVAAWVDSVTTDSISAALERSPSLPATLLEQMVTRSRGNSTASTLYELQQSVVSGTLTASQFSMPNELHRSQSLSTNDQFYIDNNEIPLQVIKNENKAEVEDEDEEENLPMTFLPVPDSEDSEVDKKHKDLPSCKIQEKSIFEARSPATKETPKKSPNVSFDASISSETKKKQLPSRRRHTSWTTTKNKSSLLQRSQSQVTPSIPSPASLSLHSQVLRKQFRTVFSMPDGANHMSIDATRQSSYLSDNVFASGSNKTSQSSCDHSPFSPYDKFVAIPSSASNPSSTQSSHKLPRFDLKLSEQPDTSTTNTDRIINEKQSTKTSSDTPSTQSVSSSSDDESHDRHGQMRGAHIDKRRDALKQLMWLLEKRPTINPRLAFGSPKPQKSKVSQNAFVEFCASFNSNCVLNSAPINELEIAAKTSPHIDISQHEPTTESNSTVIVNSDPLNQSQSSVHSALSDTCANVKLLPKSLLNTTANVSSSFGYGHRKRSSHRRSLCGVAAITRDRRNSLSKTEQQTPVSPSLPDPETPLTRDLRDVLNEHLIMINKLLPLYSDNINMQYTTSNTSNRDYIYTRLSELSQKNPMHQRCSKVEIKAFIDLICSFQMNRAHHYEFVTNSVKHLLKRNNEAIHFSNKHDESEDDINRDGHMASNESSNTSSPCLTRFTSTESNYENSADGILFEEQPLQCFRTLSESYIRDCQQTEKELTKLFDSADKQHILYCLKHSDNSGHNNELLSKFHRHLNALHVWYNLHYELTISVKKLSGLLRCDDCGDWPKLCFRSIATSRERKAKLVQGDSSSNDDYDDEDEDDYVELEEVDEEDEGEFTTNNEECESDEFTDDNDILPKITWTEELLDQFTHLRISDESNDAETNPKPVPLDRFACYRNFVYYMDKRSYQVKYDGLARTLIECVVPVLAKVRLALLQANDRLKLKMQQIVAGVCLCGCQSMNVKKSDPKTNVNTDTNTDVEDKLADVDDPVDGISPLNSSLEETTIEQWLFHVLKSCPTLKTICSFPEDVLQNNWLELHQHLGLPSLLPLYFFIINVLIDVMNECVTHFENPFINNEMLEIDSPSRLQLIREAKLILRDAVATRLFSVRMMEQFLSHRSIVDELKTFDENTIKLYTNYKQLLSTVCVNRTSGAQDDDAIMISNETNPDLYYYVDEETSELIKEYYFSRDLTVTLGNRTEIHDLCFDFSNLIQRILAQLKEELNAETEKYYQIFTIDMGTTANRKDGSCSAEVLSESFKPVAYTQSSSVPFDFLRHDPSSLDAAVSFSEQKRNDIFASTREFRRKFDTIKQRAIRVCHLAKTLVVDFSIAAEFKCTNSYDLLQQLASFSYTQVKICLNRKDADDFDNFYVFVPSWLSTEKDRVEKLLSIICSEQIPPEESNKRTQEILASYMIFLPKKNFSRQNFQWTGDTLFIQPSEGTKLALNSIELSSLHLVVNRFDHWQHAVDLFCLHGRLANVQLIRKLPRNDDIQTEFSHLFSGTKELSSTLTILVDTLNTMWNQDATKIYLTEIVKFEEHIIEHKLADLVLYIYNSGFDLFRQFGELILVTSGERNDTLREFVSIINKLFCEWCRCVTKKVKYASWQQSGTVHSKVSKPKWLTPGIGFLRFLAQTNNLTLLSEEEFNTLCSDMKSAFDIAYGNSKVLDHSSLKKARSNSVSSTSTTMSRTRGHRRNESGGRVIELMSITSMQPHQRIIEKIKSLEQDLENRSLNRKLIGRIRNIKPTAHSAQSDSVISLKVRNIDFPWRRGTRIGKGGAGIAFRAVNCVTGSIVCMKEIQLLSIASRSSPTVCTAALRAIAEEIDMIMSINHPNIVRYFGIEQYKRTIYICMEYCQCTVNEFLNDIRLFEKLAGSKKRKSVGDSDSSDQDDDASSDHIRSYSSLDVNEHVRGFVQQLLQALLTLHEHKIVHCDVKGDNIFMVNENGHRIVKLGDFNLSHRLELHPFSSDNNEAHSTQKGTIYFKPPESKYVYKSDIWALGCTIIEMLTGKLPWTNVMRPQDGSVYIYNQLLSKKGPPIPEDIKNYQYAYEFIELCLTHDLELRPSAIDLTHHPYPRVRTNA